MLGPDLGPERAQPFDLSVLQLEDVTKSDREGTAFLRGHSSGALRNDHVVLLRHPRDLGSKLKVSEVRDERRLPQRSSSGGGYTVPPLYPLDIVGQERGEFGFGYGGHVGGDELLVRTHGHRSRGLDI